jgi:hypothetical protein
MKRIPLFVFLLFVLFSCDGMRTTRGLAEDQLGDGAVCSWDTHGSNQTKCIQGNKAYLCVREYACSTEVQCAPIGPNQ